MPKLTDIYRKVKLLTPEQQSEILAQIRGMLDSTDREITFCHFCGVEKKFVKNGHKDGKQRYLCRACGRIFTERTGTELSYSQSSDDEWLEVITDTITGISIKKTSRRTGLSEDKVFRMRHTILSIIERHMDDADNKLDVIVEVDDTYFLKSVKGMTIENGYYRPPREHGAKAKKRGVSKDQVSVNVGVERKGDAYAKSVNAGKPKVSDVMRIFGNKLDSEAMVYCDGDKSFLRAFSDIASVERVEKYSKKNNIAVVNNFHTDLDTQIDRKYRGVATKYLNRYAARQALVYRRTYEVDETVDFVANLMFAPKFERVRTTDMPWNDILDLGQFEGLYKKKKNGDLVAVVDIMRERLEIIANRRGDYIS